jgi:eukaryotic-like serine/threonine-protein kinase
MTPVDPASRLSAALADRYRVERELGAGGMATVYLARDLKHERDVAIKVLKPELGAVLGAERFLNEIRTTANLQHPHLLPLFDSGEADGLLYYVMPFVEGETLRARLVAEQQLPVDETIRLITILAGALDFAHARRVVHRDLKPENILLQAGQPVIADFGIALAVAQAGGEGMTETGLSLGTPHYMSPEQAAGTHTVDARSDQFALGAIAYELLAGEPPHAGPTTQAIIVRLMTESPRAIRATRPAVPAGVEAAILRTLEKTPADRFPSCVAFAEALVAGAREVTDRPSEPAASDVDTSRADTSTPRTSASRRLAPVAAALALLVLVSIVVYLTQRTPVGDATSGITASDTGQSLAVLPFTSVGDDTANSYFAAGIADELTSALMQIPGLRLAGRVSAARVKEQGSGAREIGEALNVAAVLDGSVRRSGDRIRVSAELTSASDERVIWSQTYERALADVFAVQDDITREIVSALQVRLVGSGSAAMSARGGTADLQAYDLYLRALQHFRLRGTGLLEAEQDLEAAIARDPGYARAHALLATVLLVQPFYVPVRASDLEPRVRAAAMRAVQLDDSLADGHLALGFAYVVANEWDKAEDAYKRALALDPRSVDAHFRLGQLYQITGRIQESLAPLEVASRLDPLYPTPLSNLGLSQGIVGRTAEALATLRRVLAMDPGNPASRSMLATALLEAGRATEAAAEARTLLASTSDPVSDVEARELRRTDGRSQPGVVARTSARCREAGREGSF